MNPGKDVGPLASTGAFSVVAAADENPPSAPVIVAGGRRELREVGWRELAERSALWAADLLSRTHIDGRSSADSAWQPSTGIPVLATPGLGTLVAACACLEAGWPFVPVHARWTAAEAASWSRRMTGLGHPLELPAESDLPPDPAVTGFPEPRRASSPEEIAAVLPTSGSSGEPKGVELSRRALSASARACAARLGWREEDRWLLTLPLAHVGGFSILTRCLEARRTVVLPPPETAPGFRPAEVLRWVEEARVTLLSLVPTMLYRLLELGQPPPAYLRAVLVGGAAAPPELMAAARARGWPVLATYGLTEACSQVATEDPRELGSAAQPAGRGREASGVGRLLDGMEARLARGRPGEGGVLELRGPMLFSGYRTGPSQRVPGVGSEGWLTTGDLARLDDDGGLHILGRRDQVIVSGGENVHPIEVEQALERHPAVAAAGVLGRPDDEWGEVVMAVLDAHPSAARPLPTIGELRTFLEPHLASYKRPRHLLWTDELPHTATGKLDRRALRRLLERAERPDS
ncbi:MAG: fatty acid--CoA ligase family protein [Holophagales bacterium]|nr:fatty acid--CoA ligase family protein [Holophagales bacterium]